MSCTKETRTVMLSSCKRTQVVPDSEGHDAESFKSFERETGEWTEHLQIDNAVQKEQTRSLPDVELRVGFFFFDSEGPTSE